MGTATSSPEVGGDPFEDEDAEFDDESQGLLVACMKDAPTRGALELISFYIFFVVAAAHNQTKH